MHDTAGLTTAFDSAMECLGPFEPRPVLAVAVSGGADSMALTLLARNWADQKQGEVLALTVDHGLREAASWEADVTLSRLAAHGIKGHKLILDESGTGRALVRGPGLAARAREARYRVLLRACSDAGVLHLLLGHHRGDQAETVMMRALSSSTARGLAGIAALVETRSVRLLRPLLDVSPHRLRAYLAERDVSWVEDPSNRDPNALRARLRAARDDLDDADGGIGTLARAARTAGAHRAERDSSIGATLARRASIRPEGYAILSPGPIDPDALAALFRTIAGTAYAPPMDRIAPLARDPGPATLGGVRVLPAGRLGSGWLLIRECRAVSPAVAAAPDTIWDGRFRLRGRPPDADSGYMLGALGPDSVRFRSRAGLPARILQCLPAMRSGTELIAVPHLGVGDSRWVLTFNPRNPASSAPFQCL